MDVLVVVVHQTEDSSNNNTFPLTIADDAGQALQFPR